MLLTGLGQPEAPENPERWAREVGRYSSRVNVASISVLVFYILTARSTLDKGNLANPCPRFGQRFLQRGRCAGGFHCEERRARKPLESFGGRT